MEKNIERFDDIVIVIPCLNPDQKFLKTLRELTEHGFSKIIVVNDGSSEAYDGIFTEALRDYHIDLLRHAVNLGQGRACKTAYNHFLNLYGKAAQGIVQCDADGQHAIEDIKKCTNLLRENPDKFILGVRDFNDKSVPFRSSFGNKCTSMVFRFLCGFNIDDTQSGLKGIPTYMVPQLLETPGERFEYATSVLLDIQQRWGEEHIRQYKIKTIYIEGNRSSHFKPLIDSFRIYKTILKYSVASLCAVCIDFCIFSLAVTILGAGAQENVYFASLAAGMIAGVFNFMLNKKMVFDVEGNVLKQIVKYYCINITRAFISAFLINQLSDVLNINVMIIKVMVDTVLFFLVYYILHMWVFKRSNSTQKA